jgi:dolichol-phosphate mannosyltransferase
MMKVSVVLPTYNEADNIVGLVNSIIENVPPDFDYEILIVDDNSSDGTFPLAQEIFKSNPQIVPILRTTDRGLASSIRAGIEKATGDHVLIMDTDFTHDPKEIPKMLHLNRIFDVVVGSRFCAGGSMEDVPHYLFSLVYNWFVRIVLRTQIQDNLSGFLALTRPELESLPFHKIFFGYGDYCFRLLHYAQRRRLKIIEMPVQYQTRQKGKSKSVFWKLFFSYTSALFKLKYNASRDLPQETPAAPYLPENQ